MRSSTIMRVSRVTAAWTMTVAVAAFAQVPAGAPKPQPSGSSTPVTSQTTGTSRPTSSLASADRNFIMKAAQSDLAEIQSGKVAQTKASADAVKAFAARMVTDHTQTSDQLKTMASTRNVPLASTPSSKDEKEMKKLGEMSGADFDRAYMASQVRAHRDAVNLFEKQSKSGRDADLKSFAAATLPTLQDHLKMARELEESVRSARSKNSGEYRTK